jgi:hypothetical protein
MVAVVTALTAVWCAALVFFGVAVRIRLAERSMWLWLAAGGTLLLLSWFYKTAMHVAGG